MLNSSEFNKSVSTAHQPAVKCRIFKNIPKASESRTTFTGAHSDREPPARHKEASPNLWAVTILLKMWNITFLNRMILHILTDEEALTAYSHKILAGSQVAKHLTTEKLQAGQTSQKSLYRQTPSILSNYKLWIIIYFNQGPVEREQCVERRTLKNTPHLVVISWYWRPKTKRRRWGRDKRLRQSI